MIINNKIYKIATGTNISAHSSSENEMELFIFSKNIKKYLLSSSQTLRLFPQNETYAYNYVSKLNENFKCVCFDDNMSVIYDEN